MKKLLYFTLAILIILDSCSKKSNPKPNTVSINGTVYSTIVIGSQSWTTTNYNGTGGTDILGVTFATGKIYSFAEATAIKLPAGWRLATAADANKLATLAGATTDNSGNIDYTSANPSKLMSVNNWPSGQGTNGLGFNAVPAGFSSSQPYPLNIQYVGVYAMFWCSPSGNSPLPQVFYVVQPSAQAATVGMMPVDPMTAASLRFVKDN